jgi:imidazolonepropionase-like amidohydrolase
MMRLGMVPASLPKLKRRRAEKAEQQQEGAMRHFRRSLWFAGAVVMALWSAHVAGQAPAATRVTVYQGARVIIGDGRTLDNASFIVDGDRFGRVGTAAEVQVPQGAARVDLSGKTVIPALIDTHTHLSRTRDMLITDLQQRAYHGVGAALSLGQDAGDLFYQVRTESDTLRNAARYRTAGRGITMPEPGRTDLPYWITTAAEGRKAVQELAAKKVDIVKIWVDDRDGMYKKLTPDLYTAIIDEAHKNSLRVTAHIFTLEDAKGLLRAGLDAFAHGVRDKDVDDEFVAMMKQRRSVVLVPNLPGRQGATQAAYTLQARNLARLAKEGVTIAVGTDGNTPDGPHAEMEDMVAAGMTPAQVLVAATKNGADFLRVNAGAVQQGKSADFVVLDANPLENISNTRRINAVFMRGAAVDRATPPAAR